MPDTKISALTELTIPAVGDWVPIVDVSDTTQAASGSTKKITKTNLFGGADLPNRNVIINGAMDIWQRSTSAALSTGYISADRWKTWTGANAGTVSRSTDAPAAFMYSIKIQRTAGQTSTNAIYLNTCLESIDSRKFAGKTVTLSYYAKAGANFSPTGGSIQTVRLSTGTGTDESYLLGFTTGNRNNEGNAILTTSWVRYTHTYTLNADTNQIGILFYTVPTGTAGADDSFYITGVQLEIGSVATPFEFRHFTQELALCQRYYETFTSAPTATYSTSLALATTSCIEKRVAGTCALITAGNLVGNAQSVAVDTITNVNAGTNRLNFDINRTTADLVTGHTYIWRAGLISISAEL
jgi:hypothetical protein